MTIATGFTGGWLDRADAVRNDSDRVAALARDPRALLLRLDGGDPTTGADGRLSWVSLAGAAADDGKLLFLGLHEGVPHFCEIRAHDAPPGARRSSGLMAALAAMPAADAAIFGTARALVDWHARHRFCANCGQGTDMFRAGWARRCKACGTEHYPRVDPVVIMLAEQDGRALVGRQAAWPAGRYSALAGFVEPGESIEEAVARETFEEAGVRVRDVRYLASQPWPFPGQLMIACIGVADDPALTIDAREIEDAMWVTRDEVRAALAGADGARFLPPPAYAIAHTLLSEWAG